MMVCGNSADSNQGEGEVQTKLSMIHIAFRS